MQGDQALRAYEQSWVSDNLYEARRLFAEAHKVDPGNARICAMLGHTYVRAYADPRVQDSGDPDILKHGYELVNQAVGLDPNLPFGARTTRLGILLDAPAGFRSVRVREGLRCQPELLGLALSGRSGVCRRSAESSGRRASPVAFGSLPSPIVHAFQGTPCTCSSAMRKRSRHFGNASAVVRTFSQPCLARRDIGAPRTAYGGKGDNRRGFEARTANENDSKALAGTLAVS